MTWIYRASDLKKLIGMQNRGEITRIYTSSMQVELAEDLTRLKAEHGL